MSENQLNKEDQLFIHLVNTFVQSAWISLGKVKNPVSDELERNLDQASYYIDLLDMLQTKNERKFVGVGRAIYFT